MIRINLLAPRRDTRGDRPSQTWLVVTMLLLALEIVGLFVFHGEKEKQLDAQKRRNKEIQTETQAIQAKVADHEQVKKDLAVLRAREDAIAKLQSARTGPTSVLMEMARLLTPGRGPTIEPERLNQIRQENPLAQFNPAWDARRVWLTQYNEKERVVRVDGLARDGTDVSEFAQRLSLSPYFHEVRLLPATRDKEKGEYVSFALQTKVRY